VRRPLAAVWAVAAVLLAGCALRAPRPLQPTTASALLDVLAARRNAIASLRARAHLKSGVSGLWVREALLVERPASARVDVLAPFGVALALGVRDRLLWAYRPSEGIRFEGEATPENLIRFFGAPVAVGDVVDVLLGLPPAREPVGPPDLHTTRAGEYQLRLPLAGGEQTLWFAGDTLVLLRAEETRSGGPPMRIAFADYRDGFPRTIDLSVPGTAAGAHLVYDAVEPNVDLADTLFAPPPAKRVLPLEAAGPPPG
jgi:hypothetical protein